MKLLEAEYKKQVEEKDVVKAESKALGLTLEQLRDKLIDVQRRIADLERINETRSTDSYQVIPFIIHMGETFSFISVCASTLCEKLYGCSFEKM